MEKENIKNIRAEINRDDLGTYGIIEWRPDKKTKIIAELTKEEGWMRYKIKKNGFILNKTKTYADYKKTRVDGDEEEFFEYIKKMYGDEKTEIFFDMVRILRVQRGDPGGTGGCHLVTLWNEKERGEIIYNNKCINEETKIHFLGIGWCYWGRLTFGFVIFKENNKERILKRAEYYPDTNNIRVRTEFKEDKRTKRIEYVLNPQRITKKEKKAIKTFIKEKILKKLSCCPLLT